MIPKSAISIQLTPLNFAPTLAVLKRVKAVQSLLAAVGTQEARTRAS